MEKNTAVFPNECVATGQTCTYAAHGINGEQQCRYCGASPDASHPAPQAAAEGVDWDYCGECGSQKSSPTGYDNGQECNDCGQEWFPDIDYGRAVRANLWERMSLKRKPAAPERAAIPSAREIELETLLKVSEADYARVSAAIPAQGQGELPPLPNCPEPEHTWTAAERAAILAYGQACRAAQEQVASRPEDVRIGSDWLRAVEKAITPPAAPQPRELTVEQVVEVAERHEFVNTEKGGKEFDRLGFAQEIYALGLASHPAPQAAAEGGGYVLALETVVGMPDGKKELGYTLLSDVGLFTSEQEVHAAIAELSLPLGWVSMKASQLLPGWMLPAAPERAADGVRIGAGDPMAFFADFCERNGYASDSDMDSALQGSFYEGIRYCSVHTLAAPDHICKYEKFSSRICELGTSGCVATERPAIPAQGQSEPAGEVLRDIVRSVRNRHGFDVKPNLSEYVLAGYRFATLAAQEQGQSEAVGVVVSNANGTWGALNEGVHVKVGDILYAHAAQEQGKSELPPLPNCPEPEHTWTAAERAAILAYGQACRAAQEQAASCPDGYVLVPKVPTQEMLDNLAAFYTGCTDDTASTIYRAMIAAAPTAPAQKA